MTEATMRDFVIDLCALCKRHQVAIVNADEDGMYIVPFPIQVQTAALINITEITPDGLTDLTNAMAVTWMEEAHL